MCEVRESEIEDGGRAYERLLLSDTGYILAISDQSSGATYDTSAYERGSGSLRDRERERHWGVCLVAEEREEWEQEFTAR